MKGFAQNIGSFAVDNEELRRPPYSDIVVMALKPWEEIGLEAHRLDRFLRVEEGTGVAVLNGVRTMIGAGFAVLIPAGMEHNIINTGSFPLKFYALYVPFRRESQKQAPRR